MLEMWQPWARWWCQVQLTQIMFVMSLFELYDE